MCDIVMMLYTHFVDFENAFDSVYREGLWHPKQADKNGEEWFLMCQYWTRGSNQNGLRSPLALNKDV